MAVTLEDSGQQDIGVGQQPDPILRGLVNGEIVTYQNTRNDGDREAWHFKDEEFNRITADYLITHIIDLLNTDNSPQEIEIIDAGGSRGDMLVAVKQLIEEYDRLNGTNFSTRVTSWTVIDCDGDSIHKGEEMYGETGIHFECNMLERYLLNKNFDVPVLWLQRAVTQYQSGPTYGNGLFPEAYQCTSGQIHYFSNLLSALPTNSIIVDILSTSVEETEQDNRRALRAFEKVLNVITNGKKNLRYLTPERARQHFASLSLPVCGNLKTLTPLEGELGDFVLPGDHGRRTIEDLYERYGSPYGWNYENFYQKVMAVLGAERIFTRYGSHTIYPGEGVDRNNNQNIIFDIQYKAVGYKVTEEPANP